MLGKILVRIRSFFIFFKFKLFHLKSFSCHFNNSFRGPFKMRKSRKSKIKICKKMCSLGPLYIDVLENAELEIGNNAFFNHNCNLTVRDKVKIGNDCLFGYNVVIIDHNHIMEPSKRGTYTKKPIIIGNNVWICANVVITAGVTIGDNAIIASGAVVTKDVEPNTMYGGGTARKIKDL